MTTTSHKNTRTRTLLSVGAALLIAVFLLGFMPQFHRASGLREKLRAPEQRIEQLQRETKIAKTRHIASFLYLEPTRKNYGIAAQHAIASFSHVRAMLSDMSNPARTAALENTA